jgi:ssDNA-binding Zn-finger/Zn-ribbon topoisomerase 1
VFRGRHEGVSVLRDPFHCPECGLPMHLVTGRSHDAFLGCTGYPECRETRNLRLENGEYVVVLNERDREEAMIRWLRE